MTRLGISTPWLVALALFYLAAVVLTHFHKIAGAATVGLGLLIFFRPLGRILSATLIDSWRVLNREAAQERAAAELKRFDQPVDPRPLVVLLSTAVFLTLIEYFGDRGHFRQVVGQLWPELMFHRYFELISFGYWTGARVVGYVVLPWLVVLFMKGERLRDYGLSTRGFLRHLWVYGVLFAIVLFPVVMVSFTKTFQHTYPFYKLAARSWTDFLLWELLYALQFWALEVFFRGYMIHPLKRSMGAYAIFAMAVPYCMIHYNKPLAEVLGAVLAGMVLGTLSLRTGSIWCGALIHVSVAVSMDSLALMHTAGYPGNPRLVLP